MKVEYKEGETVLEGFLAVPSVTSGAKKPVVVIYHGLGLGGLSDFEEGRAEELAKLGFVGFAADLLGKDSRGLDSETNRALMQQLREDRPGLLRRRLLAALDHVKTYEFVDADRIGVIGYCFGGLCALDVARINVEGVKAVVSFHGTLTPLPDDTTSET
ncbi:Protein T23F4.3, partial [Aphelenchoides avenae]